MRPDIGPPPCGPSSYLGVPMGTLLAWWVALWPNLVADALAAAAAWAAHHRWTKRHTAAVHQRLDQLHARLDARDNQNGGET